MYISEVNVFGSAFVPFASAAGLNICIIHANHDLFFSVLYCSSTTFSMPSGIPNGPSVDLMKCMVELYQLNLLLVLATILCDTLSS